MDYDVRGGTEHCPPLKWISNKGTLLGTFTLPEGYCAWLLTDIGRHGIASFIVDIDHDRVVTAFHQPFAALGPSPSRRVTIVESHFPGLRDGYLIHGLTPEELERQPGFTFAPSAGYIRSLLAGASP